MLSNYRVGTNCPKFNIWLAKHKPCGLNKMQKPGHNPSPNLLSNEWGIELDVIRLSVIHFHFVRDHMHTWSTWKHGTRVLQCSCIFWASGIAWIHSSFFFLSCCAHTRFEVQCHMSRRLSWCLVMCTLNSKLISTLYSCPGLDGLDIDCFISTLPVVECTRKHGNRKLLPLWGSRCKHTFCWTMVSQW